MGDSSRRQHGSQWQQSSRGWQPGSGSRDPQQGQRRQPDSASAVDRTRRELLPPAGQDIETAWRWRPRSRPASNDDGGRRRQMEYETNRSNPSAEARFPESLVLRLLWPYSVAQMNDAVRNADPNQLNYWQSFKEDCKRLGGKAEHKTSSKVLGYVGGHGNYMLILCGSVRWQGSSCFSGGQASHPAFRV